MMCWPLTTSLPMSIPTSGPALLADVEAAIQETNTVKYCCVAGLAWIVYDILINLDREVIAPYLLSRYAFT
ncbi:hypothetical protein K438DRAFT_1819099 [Mycena galopus ATCC 62051]|nr:hypothetical protein K438DRAFT_1819099 [Mycena galopus ATCC 62051]